MDPEQGKLDVATFLKIVHFQSLSYVDLNEKYLEVFLAAIGIF